MEMEKLLIFDWVDRGRWLEGGNGLGEQVELSVIYATMQVGYT